MRENIFEQLSLVNSGPKKTFMPVLPLYLKMGMERKSTDKKSLNFTNLNKSHFKSTEFFLVNFQLAVSN